jgi:hypothetical protein
LKDLFQNSELRLAYEFMQNTGRHLFLTGKAGTGKTTFLRNLRKASWKRMVVVAPTGVAAINAGGVTIHSFFQLPFGPILPGNQGVGAHGGKSSQSTPFHRFGKEKINIIRSLDLLVIDEISMVRADLLDGIDSVLRRYRDRRKPFGGVQLLMIGDLQQLAPIVKDNEWSILKTYYDSMFFFSSRALKQTDYISIELQTVFRQSDLNFLELLNKVRDNKLDDETLQAINSRYSVDFNPPDDEGYISLTTHNYQAIAINEAKLESLPGKEKKFSAIIEGDFPEYAFPTNQHLKLKEGAQVMFIKNDSSPDKLFYNGKIGRLTEIDDEILRVTCPGEEDNPVPVVPLEWQNIKYTLDEQSKEIKESVTGRFIQYPLKLAWAVTIHKSQGLTFDKLIIDASSAFAHGQVYVALSRCKTLEGLVLSSRISPAAIRSDDTINKYTTSLKESVPDDGLLEIAKSQYQRSLLMDLFDFNPLLQTLGRLQRLLEEHSGSIDGGIIGLFAEMRAGLSAEATDVAGKFQLQIDGILNISDENIEQNSVLQERVGKGAAYFSSLLNKIAWSQIEKLYIDTDNKAAGKKINEALERLRTDLYIRIACLDKSIKKFRVKDYLSTLARSSIEVPSPGRAIKKTVVNSSVSDHPVLLERIISWRDNHAEESGKPVFQILPRRTMVAISNELPATKAGLLKIHGMGKKKAETWGSELMEIVGEYCRENNIKTSRPEPHESQGEIKRKEPTRQVSMSMFHSGRSIHEIAEERGLAVSTIEGHLAGYVETGEIPVEKLLSKEKIRVIAEYFLSTEDLNLKRAIEVLGTGYSYGELNIVLRHIAFLEKNNKPD